MSSDIQPTNEPASPNIETTPNGTTEEKEALVTQILTMQDSLLSAISRVETAKAAHSKLSEENVTMLEYINNLMAATQK
jgi:hypothetical protein